MQVFPTYHIYPPTAPHVAYMQPKANAPSFFMTDELRQVFFQNALLLQRQISLPSFYLIAMSDVAASCVSSRS